MKRPSTSNSRKQQIEEAKRELQNNNNVIYQSQFEVRKWLTKRGKQHLIIFKDNQIEELRKYFAELDDDGSGSIGVKQLQDPLIALGLSQSRQQILEMIKEVDQDQSGMIEFNQFLSIIAKATHKKKGKSQQQSSSAIHDFFKSSTFIIEMSKGQLSEQMDKNIPFKLNVSQYRRKKILQAIMSDKQGDKKQKQKANKILQVIFIYQAFKKHIALIQAQNGKTIDTQDKNDKINTRNGFPKYNKILQNNQKTLVKPDSKNIQKINF